LTARERPLQHLLRVRDFGAGPQRTQGHDMSARVLVVESHPVTRWGLGRLIAEQEGLDLVGDTGSSSEAVSMVAALVPDVVVIGLKAPDAHGLPLAKALRERFDDLGVVILTAAEDDDVLLQAFETGVSAYVAKSAPVAEFVGAVRHAAVAASSFTAAGLAAALRRQRQAATATTDLSTREREVLDHLVAGRSVPAIAALLHISPSTAKTYVSRVYEKLGARNRAEAVMAAVRLGLVSRTAAPDLLPA
jgi:DNA-binding NarL/FixJ family response regulator